MTMPSFLFTKSYLLLLKCIECMYVCMLLLLLHSAFLLIPSECDNTVMDSWTFPDLFLHSVPDHCIPFDSSSSSSSNSSYSGSPAAAASANWLNSVLPQPWMDSLQLPPAQPSNCSQNNINLVVARSSSPVQEPPPLVNNNNKAPQRRRNTKKRAVIQDVDLIVDDNNMISGGSGSKLYRTSACRVVSERQRRKILGDSILALKALLPLNQSKQIDKCSILKEAGKHILTLKEEMQELVKKKEDLSRKKAAAAPELLLTSKEKEMVPNSVNAVMPDNANNDDNHNITDVEEKERVTLHYCNGSSAFLTMRIPATSGSEIRLSTVLSALEKANMDIINAVTSWTQDSRSFRFMAHAKIGDAASAQALKEELLRIACWR